MTDMPKITGATRLYVIIGDPIAQARSPEVFTARFTAAGVDGVLVPAHVPVAGFDAIVPALLRLANLDGLLVTAPFKARMLAFADRLGATARCIGAVNALRREADGSWTGDMFDGAGFVNGLERKGEQVRGRRVALFGAGGAGSAIACALAAAQVLSISIVDTDTGKAAALAARLRPAFPDVRFDVATWPAGEVDMIVNATPVGMRPDDGMPAEIGPLPPGTLVGDVVISNAPTALIRHAASCACRWVDGKDMHSGQIEAIMSFFAPRGAAPGMGSEPERGSETQAGLQAVAN
jgi:shikimate dehydrogenase